MQMLDRITVWKKTCGKNITKITITHRCVILFHACDSVTISRLSHSRKRDDNGSSIPQCYNFLRDRVNPTHSCCFYSASTIARTLRDISRSLTYREISCVVKTLRKRIQSWIWTNLRHWTVKIQPPKCMQLSNKLCKNRSLFRARRLLDFHRGWDNVHAYITYNMCSLIQVSFNKNLNHIMT